MGVPDLKRPVSLWISDKGIPKLPGPFSAGEVNLIYMGPISYNEEQRAQFDKGEAARGGKRKMATNESLDELGTDGAVFGHELTHSMIHDLLAGTDAKAGVQGPVEEALADYFPMSAKNMKEPVLGFGVQFQGLPMREDVQRQYEGEYPEHLNFNTVAQISGDVHNSSQVIGRYLWQLRSQFGREKLDKAIVAALPLVSRFRRQSEPLFRSPPTYGRAQDPIATFRNQREAYVFLAALMRASQNEGWLPAEREALVQLAGPFGLPADVLNSIRNMKLDPVVPPKPVKAVAAVGRRVVEEEEK